MTERVFVVRRADHFHGDWPHGFRSARDPDIDALPARFLASGFFADRPTAEAEPAWKQIIPYCVVRRGSELFCVQRLARQSEARLHGKLSIGIGGHVEPIDAGSRGEARGPDFAAALRRELDEELIVPGLDHLTPRFRGLLNDDSTEVGRVHVGLVYELDVTHTPPATRAGIAIRETRKMHGGFRPLDEPFSTNYELARSGLMPEWSEAAQSATPPESQGGSQGEGADSGSPARVARLSGLWQDASRWESWSRILLQEDFSCS